jgi:hypothetical protein
MVDEGTFSRLVSFADEFESGKSQTKSVQR